MIRRLTLMRAGVACALGVMPLALGGSARAASPSLGGWNISADGNAIDMVYDNATGLAGIHPLDEADFPEAQSVFETGPFGSALATVFWPGAPGGDFGSLSAELGIPPQLEPLFSQLNDPVRAATQYPAGPSSASYPQGAPGGAAEMESKSTATGSSATAALSDEGVPGNILGFSSAKGTSSSGAGSDAIAEGSSDVGGISILGGLVDIASVSSTAKASSDGNRSSGSATTHVSGVTVLGEPASLGSDGLVLPDFAKSFGPLLGPIVQKVVSQEFSALGLKVAEFPSSRTRNGASISVASGGVSVELIPPASVAPLLEGVGQQIAPFFPQQAAIIPTLPGLLQGATLTFTFGRATASAAASPPFSFSFTPPPIPLFPVTPAITPAVTPAGTPATTPPAAVSPASTAAAPAAAPVEAAPVASQVPMVPISLSSPLGAGAVVLGLLVAMSLGYGLWRLAKMALPEDGTPACPLRPEEA